MEFLVRIELALRPDMAADARDRLLEQERARGQELRAEGVIQRIWRLPGCNANGGIWQAPAATALHEAISSLPFFPWMDTHVTPLPDHHLEHD
jgi:muconolactone D-isomerase